MAPKRKPKAEAYAPDGFVVRDDEEEEYAPAGPPKTAKKTKQEAGAGAGADGAKKPPAKKPKAPKKEAGPKPANWDVCSEEACPEQSVIAHLPPGEHAKEGLSKIAAFDFDGTLVNTKMGTPFAKDKDDWREYNASVREKLQSLVDDGYKLVVFTNQGAIRKALHGVMAEKVTHRINDALKHFGVLDKCTVLCACQNDNYRKPNTGMFDLFEKHFNGGVEVDRDNSMFVGDADGSNPELGDSDKAFAEALCLPFQTSEEFFGPPMELADYFRANPDANAAGAGGAGPNAKVVQMFQELAMLTNLTHDEKKAFKVSAYRKAATALESFAATITVDNLKEVGKLPGVGKASLDKIKELLTNGSLAKIAELRTELGYDA